MVAAPFLAPGVTAVRAPRTLREKVESLFMVSFGGTVPGGQILDLLRRHALGGVTLFTRNCVSPPQIRSLLAGLQSASRLGLLVSVDEEGGGVLRIRRGVPAYPWEAEYGRLGSPARVGRDATTMGGALRGMGLTMNLAPVVDVLANPRSPIGLRSYGSDPALVARLAAAAVRGYQSRGLAATAKHFIGLGHTSIDSHAGLPTVNLTWAQLERADLIPFRAAIAAGVSAMLVAHVALPRVDTVPGRAASLSPAIVGGRIRGTLRFNGVVLTDSLVMGALARPGPAEAAELAFAAGADLLLLAYDKDIPTGTIEEAIDRVYRAVRARRIPERRVDESVGRIAALKRRYGPRRLR